MKYIYVAKLDEEPTRIMSAAELRRALEEDRREAERDRADDEQGR